MTTRRIVVNAKNATKLLFSMSDDDVDGRGRRTGFGIEATGNNNDNNNHLLRNFHYAACNAAQIAYTCIFEFASPTKCAVQPAQIHDEMVGECMARAGDAVVNSK